MSGVTISGLRELQAKLKRIPSKMAKATEQHVYRDEVAPLAEGMRARAYGLPGPARKAVSTVRVRPVKGGGKVEAGGGSGRASRTVYGSEYGGQKRSKRAYVYRSKLGRGYIARRRATQQFGPFLGRRGYWFWPTMRSKLRGFRGRLQKVVNDVMTNG